MNTNEPNFMLPALNIYIHISLSPFIKRINMAASNLNLEMLAGLATNYKGLEITSFQTMTCSSVFQINNKRESFTGDVPLVPNRKQNSNNPAFRTPKFKYNFNFSGEILSTDI